jgi:acetyl esterase/lipase
MMHELKLRERVMSIYSYFVSKVMGRGDRLKNRGLRTPDDIERFDDIVYGHDEQTEILDVYRPKSAGNRKLPILISVHGGGWVYGDKEVYQYYGMSLAQQGFAVINYTYPLAPKAKYPSLVMHAYDVFAWAKQHADQYHFDVDHLFAVGDSVGAHTLVQLCLILSHSEYAERFAIHPDTSLKPKAIALNCGLYDLRKITKLNLIMKNLIKDYLTEGFNGAEFETMNVLPFITSDFPPSYVMSSTGDFLADQAPKLVAKLTEVGVHHTYQVYGSKHDRLGHVFHCDLRLKEAHQCNLDQGQFFKQFIK